MRKEFVLAIFMVFAATGWAANLKIVPTTTLAAQSSNNTSAANSFTTQIEREPRRRQRQQSGYSFPALSGAEHQGVRSSMLWFGITGHMNVGYSSRGSGAESQRRSRT